MFANALMCKLVCKEKWCTTLSSFIVSLPSRYKSKSYSQFIEILFSSLSKKIKKGHANYSSVVVCWGRLWQILFSFASSFTPDDNWFKLLLFICNISPFKKMPKHQNRQRRLIFFLADCFDPFGQFFFKLWTASRWR